VRKDLFVALTLATLLSGHATAIADELTGTLAKVKELGYITIGHREASVPFRLRAGGSTRHGRHPCDGQRKVLSRM
jgi:glutamate/aspartate transport system substrate-binding protein